jgi:mannose-6-phosphate isomerase-like protein (cupin superfamily)
MRRFMALAGVLVLSSIAASAQQPAAQPASAPTPDSDPTRAHYMSAVDIAAGLQKLGNDRADIAFRIFQIPPYNINAAQRAPVTQVANVHDDQAELFIVLDGTGTMVTGGKVLGEKRNGANVTGTSIEGGTRQKLSKGDFLIVPAGVPHWFTDLAPGGLSLMQLYLPKK